MTQTENIVKINLWKATLKTNSKTLALAFRGKNWIYDWVELKQTRNNSPTSKVRSFLG
jgi:hypothetical protein